MNVARQGLDDRKPQIGPLRGPVGWLRKPQVPRIRSTWGYSNSTPSGPARGFTLIELIVVMMLLATVMAMSTPTLSNFFRGRRAKEESRRVLMLTRYARSEAVAEAVPVEVWFDADKRHYGMRPEGVTINPTQKPPVDDTGATIEPRLLVEFELADGVEMVLDAKQKNTQGQGTIVFMPDGTIDEDSSMDGVAIREQSRSGEDTSKSEIAIVRSEVGMGYVIK